MEGQGRIDDGAEITVRGEPTQEQPLGEIVKRWNPLRRLRDQLAGRERPGRGMSLDVLNNPLDLLASHGLITEEMWYEGARFAMLAWWLFGTPAASCQGLYERMLAGGMGEDFSPRPEGAEADEERLARIASQKARFGRMSRALEGKPSRLNTVRRICQFLKRPALINALADGAAASPEALRELTYLSEGLARLVELRRAEDRYRSRLDRIKQSARSA